MAGVGVKGRVGSWRGKNFLEGEATASFGRNRNGGLTFCNKNRLTFQPKLSIDFNGGNHVLCTFRFCVLKQKSFNLLTKTFTRLQWWQP